MFRWASNFAAGMLVAVLLTGAAIIVKAAIKVHVDHMQLISRGCSQEGDYGVETEIAKGVSINGPVWVCREGAKP